MIPLPQAENIKAGTLESVDENGDVISETEVVVYLSGELSQEDPLRMEHRLKGLYGEECNVICIGG